MPKERVYELAKQLIMLKAKERNILNELDKVRRLIVETEIEMSQAVELSEGKKEHH